MHSWLKKYEKVICNWQHISTQGSLSFPSTEHVQKWYHMFLNWPKHIFTDSDSPLEKGHFRSRSSLKSFCTDGYVHVQMTSPFLSFSEITKNWSKQNDPSIVLLFSTGPTTVLCRNGKIWGEGTGTGQMNHCSSIDNHIQLTNQNNYALKMVLYNLFNETLKRFKLIAYIYFTYESQSNWTTLGGSHFCKQEAWSLDFNLPRSGEIVSIQLNFR